MPELAKPKAKPKSATPSRSTARKAGSGGSLTGITLQEKLIVGPAHDRFETEADRVAGQIMSGSAGVPSISTLSSGAHTDVARKNFDPDPVQRKSTTRAKDPTKDDDEKEATAVQRDAIDSAPPVASSGVEHRIQSSRGSGRRLAEPARSKMESGFSRSFEDVRIHDNSNAHLLNADLSSRAFTVGRDIFFARGQYQPASTSGQRLLAHELTHVIQQGSASSVQAKRIQRNGNGAPDPTPQPSETETQLPSWTDPRNANRGIDLGSDPHVYRLSSLRVPVIDGKKKGVDTIGSVTGGPAGLIPATGEFRWEGKGSRAGQSQTQIWDNHLRGSQTIAQAINDSFTGAPAIFRNGDESQKVYFLRISDERRSQIVIIGTATELAQDRYILRPTWTDRGGFSLMEVDHWREIQLAGSHHIDNLWLLDKEANGTSGNTIIKGHVMRNLRSLVQDAQSAGFFEGENAGKQLSDFRKWPNPDEIHIVFAGQHLQNLRGSNWDKNDIASGDHIQHLSALNLRELKREGFALGPDDRLTRINLFLSETSAFRRRMRVGDGTLTPERRRRPFIRGFDLQEALYTEPENFVDGQRIGSLRGLAFGSRRVRVPGPDGQMVRTKPIDVQMVLDVPIISKHSELGSTTDPALQFGFGGYIDRAYINRMLRDGAERGAVLLAGFSPVQINSAGLTEDWALEAEGRVSADVPLFQGFEFAIRAEGDAIFIDAPIPVDRLQFDPFRVTEANLQVGFDDDGPFIGGNAAFVIDGVGQGSVQARRLSLAGNFNFDLDAFDPARIDVGYAAGQWNVGATLGFKENTIPGVVGGEVSVSVGPDGFTLSGSAELGGPGIPAGTELVVAYDEERGLTIGGTLPINTERIPGVRGAEATVIVTRSADGEWTVNGGGTAEIELPGVTGTLTVSYVDGVLTISGVGNVARPPMNGSVSFTATNAPADEEGNPVEGEPLSRFRTFGSGSVSIQFGRYITGTAGVTLLENGEIELMGRIALPPEITLIDERRWDYDILDFPQIRFPIIGFTIPVIRRSFGVFGYVGGGIDAEVTVGPGVLRDSAVEAVYNPDHPEDMSITGQSQFDMRAGAEVGLSIVGGIGAGLGIVEATGEVGIRGALGLELVGGTRVEIAWTPSDGLELDASVFGEARPRFSISLIADARVVVDAFLWSGTLWNEDWDHELGSFGPNMVWRAELPARWSERDGLDVDINRLEITRPDIDVRGMAVDVFESVI